MWNTWAVHESDTEIVKRPKLISIGAALTDATAANAAIRATSRVPRLICITSREESVIARKRALLEPRSRLMPHNAAVQRPRDQVSSATHVHNEMAHVRRACADLSRSAATAC